ncbi:FAD-binding oxidoreductase [Leptolyngbya ohadii]|uniref:FAD-binding oxidoreductase n=1 Tax=Leptolyngbya ohadii TaxID=1962290 RepID=UPI000B5A1CE3|nr:FAD-binding oxidoreductase [Leptolyngbya ohadii]
MTVAEARSIDWNAIVAELEGIEMIRDAAQVAKLSKDYYTYSPLLQAELNDKVGDIVIRPANEAEVMRVAAVCAKHQIPLTVRGAGTGNYGQCVPLKGGVILEMTKMQAVKWVKPGIACVEAGAKLAAIDKQTREMGWEIRMAPSTYRTASIGGFIGGGSGGIGSITYGLIADRGNLLAMRVVTVEENPRVIELRGDDVYKVAHAWGTNGIITELEIPLAPAYPWAELIVTFPDFMTAARFGQTLGDSDGIIKKLITIFAAPIHQYFAALRNVLNAEQHSAFVLIAEPCLESFGELVKEFGGTIVYQKSAQEATKGLALGEFTWNHTTLHARSIDPSITYLQTIFPADKELKLVEHLYHHFGDEVIMHLEFIRSKGTVIPAALQLVRYTTADRLNEIIRYHEEQGAFIANPHTYIIEEGGRKTIDPMQLQFKEMVDPTGLLNPGKMRTWDERKAHAK